MFKHDVKLNIGYGAVAVTVFTEKAVKSDTIVNNAIKEVNSKRKDLVRKSDIITQLVTTTKVKQELRNKSDIIKEFMSDELELNQYAREEAEECGKTLNQFCKDIAETQFDIMLGEGSIIKVGRKFFIK